jgi:hypothetical protein
MRVRRASKKPFVYFRSGEWRVQIGKKNFTTYSLSSAMHIVSRQLRYGSPYLRRISSASVSEFDQKFLF